MQSNTVERKDASKSVLQSSNSAIFWGKGVCLFLCWWLFCFPFQKDESNEDFVQVRRRDLERLTTEVMQLRDFLPKILDGDIVWTFQKLDAIESSELCHVVG